MIAMIGSFMKRFGIIFICLTCFMPELAGCAYIRHYRELMVLKRFAENQKEIEKYVDKHETSFYRLRDDLQNNRLTKGLFKERILSMYDEPIFCKTIVSKDRLKEICLYRHPTHFFTSDKIYLTFGAEHQLQSWKLIKHE